MSRRLFRQRPDLLLVEEDGPLIKLPDPPPPSPHDLEDERDDTEDTESHLGLEDEDSFVEDDSAAVAAAAAPLRVFLGSPGVSTSSQREQLAAKVGGPIWDASSLGSRAAARTGSSAPALARLGERPLRDALAEAAAALEDQGLGGAVQLGRPRSVGLTPQPSLGGVPHELEAPEVQAASGFAEGAAPEPWDESSSGSWNSVADDDSWDAGAFGEEGAVPSGRGGGSLTLELPPLVVPRNRLHDATTTIPMDLPSEPPRNLLDDDPSLPIEAVEGDAAHGFSELSLPPRPATHDLLRYSGGLDGMGSGGDFGSGGGFGGDDLLEAEEAPEAFSAGARAVLPEEDEDEYSWESSGRLGRPDPPTGVPLGVPSGSRLSQVKSASTPPRRPARPMPAVRPRSTSTGGVPWAPLMVAAVLIGVLGGGYLAGVFDSLLGRTSAPAASGDVGAEVQVQPAEVMEALAVGGEGGAEAGEVAEAPSSPETAAAGSEGDYVPLDPKLMNELQELVKSGSSSAQRPSTRTEEASDKGRMERMDTGRLIVRVNTEATIYVNGERQGVTPMDPITLGAGQYLIRAIDNRTKRSQYRDARVDSGVASEVRFSF